MKAPRSASTNPQSLEPARSAQRPRAISAVVARLRKSLPGVDVRAASLAPSGGFSHDREFALFDEAGYVNGKRESRVHAFSTDGMTLLSVITI